MKSDLIHFEGNLCLAVGRSENLGRQAVIEDHLMEQVLLLFQPKSDGEEGDPNPPTTPLLPWFQRHSLFLSGTYLPLLCQILKIMFCWSCLCTVSMISAILCDHSVPHLIAKDSNNCDEYCNLSAILEFHEIL
jgi:hypothetical protein